MTKRPHDSLDDGPTPRKKRIVAHEQCRPKHMELAPQIPSFAGGQLLRSIAAALRLAGFDSATPSALEMFRAQVEEYMLRFAKEIKTSMAGQRRTAPVAQDFSFALANTANTRAARVLKGQLTMKLPEEITCPRIPDPPAAPPPEPDLSALLQPLIKATSPSWIPKHFPQLPSQHSWKATDVWPAREKDGRKMREKATEEGMLAEQALRKLAQAAKTSALQDAGRGRNALAGAGKPRSSRRNNDDLLGSLLQDVRAGDDVGLDGAADSKEQSFELADSVLVDSDAAHWRGGRRQGIAF